MDELRDIPCLANHLAPYLEALTPRREPRISLPQEKLTRLLIPLFCDFLAVPDRRWILWTALPISNDASARSVCGAIAADTLGVAAVRFMARYR